MKITSFEHGCEVCGYNPDVLPEVSQLPAIHQRATVATFKLFVISQASWKADGKIPDWNNSIQQKWRPLFDMEVDENNPTGFRFHASDFDYVVASAGGGSRLCYPSREDSDYHGQQHLDLYRDMMVCQDTDQQALNPVSAPPRADGQDAILRQLVKSNLQLQAQVRMLAGIVGVSTAADFARRWGLTEIESYLTGAYDSDAWQKKKSRIMEVSLGIELQGSPLAEFLDAADRQELIDAQKLDQ